jgi:hypothetical protein
MKSNLIETLLFSPLEVYYRGWILMQQRDIFSQNKLFVGKFSRLKKEF